MQIVPAMDAWSLADKRLFLKLLNREPQALILAIHRWGGVSGSKELLPVARRKEPLPEISPLESARAHLFFGAQRRAFSKKKAMRREWEVFDENRALAKSQVDLILRVAEETAMKKPSRWRQQLLSNLWRCLKCQRFFLGKTKRQHVYCCRKCASKATAATAMRRRRFADDMVKIRKVRLAFRRWRARSDWKERSAKSAGVTRNWITYAIRRGYLKLPKLKKEN
jgi:hypothetical protein